MGTDRKEVRGRWVGGQVAIQDMEGEEHGGPRRT